MPDQLTEELRKATADLHVRWATPEELRRRATRRRRRLFASLSLLSVLALAAAGRFAIVNTGSGPSLPPNNCSNVDLDLPESEAGVRVAVYDATGRPDLAEQAAAELRSRRFDVDVVAPQGVGLAVDVVAVVRYGPSEVGEAHILRAYLRNEAVTEFDAARDDGIVDVILGPAFESLATPNEMRQTVALMGRPENPC